MKEILIIWELYTIFIKFNKLELLMSFNMILHYYIKLLTNFILINRKLEFGFYLILFKIDSIF
jgi:hypothetical protein